MCFSNSFYGRWPIFGSESRKNRLHDFAEDVPFEEVKDPVIDEEARAAQIGEAVLEETKELMQKTHCQDCLSARFLLPGHIGQTITLSQNSLLK